MECMLQPVVFFVSDCPCALASEHRGSEKEHEAEHGQMPWGRVVFLHAQFEVSEALDLAEEALEEFLEVPLET
jgi:hypothetical protein